MSTRRSAHIDRVEVITRGARRRWCDAEKRAIVLESLAPGVMVSAVCRQHGIGSGQLSTWRRQMREGRLGEPYPPILHFAEAVVEPPPVLPLPRLPANDAREQPQSKIATTGKRPPLRRGLADGGAIEIVLPNEMVVRVGADVDQAALSRVLAALKSS